MTDLAHQDLATVPVTYRTLEAICSTELVPAAYRNRPHAALAAVLMGRELGLRELQSLNLIDVIDGKATLSAELVNAMIRRAGHSIRVDAYTDEGCTLTGTRGDNGDTATVSFTLADAERAGLAGKRNYRTYPADMCFARAISRLARVLFPDAVSAVHTYTPQDLDPDADPLPAADVLGGEPAAIEYGDTIPEPGEVPEAVEVAEVVELAPRPQGDEAAAYDLFVALLNTDPTSGTMADIEGHVRELARLGTALGYVGVERDSPYPDWLHAVLADHDAEHVADLRRAELIEFALDLRARLADAEMDQGPPL